MTKLKQFAIVSAIASSILFSTAFSQVKSTVVAEFGKYKITLEEFKIAYLDLIKKPNIYDSKKLREDFLDEMIQTKLFAAEAKKLGMEKDELITSKIDSYKKKVLREAHFDNQIKSNIKISEKEIEEAYSFLQEERKISHLFVPTKEKADSLYSLLEKGADWNSLAASIFKDSVLSKSGGDLGWVYWDQLDHELSMVAYRLKPGVYSKPVKSTFGYHIIKVTDYKKKPMITRSEYELHRRKAKTILQYKIGDEKAAEYINKLAKSAKIVIYPEVFRFVFDQLNEKFKRKPTQFNPMSDIQLTDSEIKNIKTNLWDERNRVLAKVNGSNFTVADLLSYINYIPYEVIYTSAKATIDYAFRDYLITKEAEKLGLARTEFVRVKSNIYSNNLLASEFRKSEVRKVELTEKDLKDYFQKKYEKSGASYEVVKSVIEKMALEEKKRETIANLTSQVLAKLKVKKNLKPIHEYYDMVLSTKN